MSFSCLSVSLPQPCDPRLWNGSASYSLPPAHTASPWKQLVRPCLAAGSEDLSSAASVPHRFSHNKSGFLVGVNVRSLSLSSLWVWELFSNLLHSVPGEPLSCPDLLPLLLRSTAGFLQCFPLQSEFIILQQALFPPTRAFLMASTCGSSPGIVDAATTFISPKLLFSLHSYYPCSCAQITGIS